MLKKKLHQLKFTSNLKNKKKKRILLISLILKDNN